MYENKIENFTDQLFYNLNANKIASNPATYRRDSLGKKKYDQKGSKIPIIFNRGLNTERKSVGLNKKDIDKLQLMSFDLSAQNYLSKLIKIYEQERDVRAQQNLRMQQTEEGLEGEDQFYRTNPKKNTLAAYFNINCNEKDEIKETIELTPKIRSIIEKKSNLSPDEKIEVKDTSQQQFLDRSSQLVYRTSIQKPKSFTRRRNSNDVKVAKSQDKKFRQVSNSLMKKSKNVNISKFKNEQTKGKINIKQIQVNIQFTKTMELDSDIKLEGFKLQRQNNSDQLKQNSEILVQGVPTAKQLQQICYAQIGKRMVSATQNEIRRQLFNTNIHIRSYLIKNIVDYVKELAQNSPGSIFIIPNQRGLHFEPNAKPKQLNAYLQHTKYVHIIRDINHIIQKSIYKEKYKESALDFWPYVMIGLFLGLIVMLIIAIFLDSRNENLKNFFLVCTGLMVCVFLVVLIGYSLHCYRKQSKFRPVCDIIYEEIDSYFKFINGKMQSNLEWIIGQAFFWIEIKIHAELFKQVMPKTQKHGRQRKRHKYFNQILKKQSNQS